MGIRTIVTGALAAMLLVVSFVGGAIAQTFNGNEEPSEDVTAQFRAAMKPAQPVTPPQINRQNKAALLPLPQETENTSSASQSASSPQTDNRRQMLREIALLLLGSHSPAQRRQGLQMLYELNQPTVAEEDEAERQRLLEVINAADATPEAKRRAAIAVQLGAKPETVLEILSK
jgi:hypothetical protein